MRPESASSKKPSSRPKPRRAPVIGQIGAIDQSKPALKLPEDGTAAPSAQAKQITVFCLSHSFGQLNVEPGHHLLVGTNNEVRALGEQPVIIEGLGDFVIKVVFNQDIQTVEDISIKGRPNVTKADKQQLLYYKNIGKRNKQAVAHIASMIKSRYKGRHIDEIVDCVAVPGMARGFESAVRVIAQSFISSTKALANLGLAKVTLDSSLGLSLTQKMRSGAPKVAENPCQKFVDGCVGPVIPSACSATFFGKSEKHAQSGLSKNVSARARRLH